jgi:hypothetical protein
VFKFLELGLSNKEIHSLSQALHKETGRYFVGAMCLDKKVCDFSDAAPKPPLRGFTPAKTVREIFFLQ